MRIKADIKGAIGILILALLVLTPVFNIGEIFGCITGKLSFSDLTFKGTIPVQTPLYVKFIKDAGFLIIILLCICNLRKLEKDKLKLLMLFIIPMSLLTAVLFVLSCKTSFVRALIGLRWISPAFLAVFLIGNVNDSLMEKMAKVASIVLMISLSFQIYEQFIIKPPIPINDLQGFLKYHLSYDIRSRSGIFTMYHNAGLFACATLFLVYFYIKKSNLRMLTLCLIPINILLSSSGTTLPTYILANYLILVKGKISRVSMIIFIFLGSALVITLPFLVSRPSIFNNLFSRVNQFNALLRESGLVSTQFGKATNAMALFWHKFGGPIKGSGLDSTINGVIVNTGLIGISLAVLTYIIWVIFILRSRRLDAIVFTFIYTLFSLTVPIMEAFPGNLIFAVSAGYFIPIIFLRKKEKDARCN
ncbi:MAG: hypothetical protein WC738_06760 [Candidatus Omnitrophota bacterium]|jgi:hypothetical protein